LRVDPHYVNTLAAAVDQSSSMEDQLTSELSSGLRVSSLQDDPVAVAESAVLNSAIAKGDTYVQTASTGTSRMQVADSTLGEVVKQLTSALTLAVQSNNGTLNAANHASIAQQLEGLRDQVLALANTTYLGQYLFSGSQGSVQPFTLDTSTSPATATYNGDAKLQYIETPSGQKIQTNLPGSNLFDGATGALAALNQLISDVSSGAGGAALTSDTGSLRDALDQVTNQRSVLDTSLAAVQESSTYIQTQVARLTVQQSGLVAADPAMVATQLSSAETQHQALLSVMSAINKTDLFDYLH
jgi:flagellar hook-associated protein 3 FlgL